MHTTIFKPAHLLLPSQSADYQKWAVIACDQFTSQPNYWQDVEKLVGDSPSTLRLVLPEAYLENDADRRIDAINKTMEDYRRNVLTQAYFGYVYVERTLENGKIRQGLVGCVDLEAYSFEADAAPRIRPTEDTVVERIPPRQKIRRHASLESPHILMLLDDAEHRVIEPLAAVVKSAPATYSVDLMLGGGKLEGWVIEDEATLRQIAASYESYAAKAMQQTAYGGKNTKPFEMAMGDGNHSLATAKAHWDEVKKALSEDERRSHPARFCLVELENIHSDAIEFEPIHRLIMNITPARLKERLTEFAAQRGVTVQTGDGAQSFTLLHGGEKERLSITGSDEPLTVGFIQSFADWLLKVQDGTEVDYIHGEKALGDLCRSDGVGILLPELEKSELFKGVALGGVLPEKTFSMGHAKEKRYYMECRQIVK